MPAVLERSQTDTDTLTAPMPTRPLGSLGWNASLLTLGGVKWDTKCDDAEAAALVHRAIALGINTFDTAWAYGNGESERKLGLALEGVRENYWVNTKVIDRTYDGAMRQMDESFKRLRTDYVDLMFVHSVDSAEQGEAILGPNSVLKAVEERKAAGQIRHIGVSGHWVRETMLHLLREYPFEAVLFPVGLFNLAYNYSFADTVLPLARAKNLAVLGMKIYASGRIRKVNSLIPYLRYSTNLDIDTAIIGMDDIAQLEENVRAIKGDLPPLSQAEQQALFPECLAVTQEWDEGEFSWVQGYTRPEGQ